MANEQDRDQVGQLAEGDPESEQSVGDPTAYVNQEYPGQNLASAVLEHGIMREVVKLPEAKRGFVLLPGVGWSSAASVGPPAFAAWPAITNGSPKPWPAPARSDRCLPADTMNIVQHML